uniref:Band 7 domain-containing protein n=1 Tax=Arcella intermedia TaxID=1963864 RepID=A0A6B2L8A0_9EUKA
MNLQEEQTSLLQSEPNTKPPKNKKQKFEPFVQGAVMTDVVHDYPEEDLDCASSFFQSCLSLKGIFAIICCTPFACLGCGPTVEVPEGKRAAVLKFGKLDRILSPGTHYRNIGSEVFILVPVSVMTLEIPSQRVMTRDNVSVVLDAVCFYQIVDVKRALFNVRDYEKASRNLAQSSLESLLAEHTLDELISERADITKKTTKLLDKHTTHWGIHVHGLEIRDIRIPDSMQRVMAIAAEAKREGQAAVIMAEAELKAAETFAKAAVVMGENPIALQLRYFQTLKEIAAEQNSTILVPSEVTNMFRGLGRWDESQAFGGSLDKETIQGIKAFIAHQKKLQET